jgi:hypothetical protein
MIREAWNEKQDREEDDEIDYQAEMRVSWPQCRNCEGKEKAYEEPHCNPYETPRLFFDLLVVITRRLAQAEHPE